jgi:hypothetical protein
MTPNNQQPVGNIYHFSASLFYENQSGNYIVKSEIKSISYELI